jgi:hypothetical protein
LLKKKIRQISGGNFAKLFLWETRKTLLKYWIERWLDGLFCKISIIN